MTTCYCCAMVVGLIWIYDYTYVYCRGFVAAVLQKWKKTKAAIKVHCVLAFDFRFQEKNWQK